MSDVFCIADNLQFARHDFVNRNRIRGALGAEWLSVPVYLKGHSRDPISEMRIVQDGWSASHLRSIRLAYEGTSFFERYFDGLQQILLKRHTFLSDLNHELLLFLLDALALKTKIVRATDYALTGKKNEYIIRMCRRFGAQTYIFGSLGRNYADSGLFKEAGIEILFLDYRHPVYRQRRRPFVSNLSVIDLLFNEGPKSLEILTSRYP